MSQKVPQISLNSYEDVDKAITSFKRLARKKGLKDEHVKEQFFNKFGVFFLMCKYYDSDFLANIPIYRARPAIKIKDPRDINEYGAPPIDKQCGIGRANLNGRNVFYGNSNALGALIETKEVYDGNKFYVGRWVFNKKKFGDKDIAVSSYINTTKKKKGPWEDVLVATSDEQRGFFSQYYGEVQAEIIQYLVRELSKLFLIRSDRYYPLTGFLADQVIYSPNFRELPNFLLYPSVIDDSFLNLALHPTFIQDYFILEKVVKVEVIGELKNNSLKVLPTEFGFIEYDKIHFYQREINLDERAFAIDKLRCNCGENFELDNPEELVLINTKDKTQKNLRQVVQLFLSKSKSLGNPDYNEVSSNLFEEDGVAAGIHQKGTIYLEDWAIKMPDDLHKFLLVDCEIIQKFNYIKL